MEGMEYFFAKCAEHGHSTQLSLNHTAYMAEDIFVRAGTKKKSMIRQKSERNICREITKCITKIHHLFKIQREL